MTDLEIFKKGDKLVRDYRKSNPLSLIDAMYSAPTETPLVNAINDDMMQESGLLNGFSQGIINTIDGDTTDIKKVSLMDPTKVKKLCSNCKNPQAP